MALESTLYLEHWIRERTGVERDGAGLVWPTPAAEGEPVLDGELPDLYLGRGRFAGRTRAWLEEIYLGDDPEPVFVLAAAFEPDGGVPLTLPEPIRVQLHS